MNKLLTGILASTMLLSTLGTSFAQETAPKLEQQEIHTETLGTYSGQVSATVSWTMVGGHLTISGTGDIPSPFDGMEEPYTWWPGDYSELKYVTIKEGITGIRAAAFQYAHWLKTVEIPNTVTTIGSFAFDAVGVDELILPNSVTTLDYSAFYSYGGDLYIPPSVTEIGEKALDDFIPNQFSEKIIYVYAGSYIESYCQEMGLNYAVIDYVAQWEENTDTQPSTPDVAPEPAPESAYPEWATTFIDYVYPSIMPDLTPANYNDGTSRGTIAQSMYNLAGNGVEVSATKDFHDLGDYGTAIAWCNANGIMDGMGDDYFGTNQVLQREQFCLILKKLAEVSGKTTISGDVSALEQFSDGWSIPDWAKEGVAWAVSNKLMEGSDNALNPQGDVTRLEVAIMLAAFDNL